jgi:hypothetical protein
VHRTKDPRLFWQQEEPDFREQIWKESNTLVFSNKHCLLDLDASFFAVFFEV